MHDESLSYVSVIPRNREVEDRFGIPFYLTSVYYYSLTP
jgi:hypothetical protein